MLNFENFAKVRVLVVGDVMMDKYLWGDVTRISPEAPVPVVKLRTTSFRVGGAANVAANIVGLGATAHLIGITGQDAEGKIFAETLEKTGVSAEYIFSSKERVTTTKTRIIAHQQQVARIDHESAQPLNEDEEREIWEIIEKAAVRADIIVISDYAKGMLTEQTVSRLIKYGNANNKTILVDPKGRDYSKYKNASIITPNKFEIAEACGCAVDSLQEIVGAVRKLIDDLNLQAVIVTRGEEGVLMVEKDGESFAEPAVGRTVFDVTGAGDTFISTLATALGAGLVLADAIKIANLGAGLAVEEIGTTVVNFESLENAFKEIAAHNIT